ncbi:putative cytochrome P450 [Mrakia frigida]|uniref:cytochrome P450 n=1 Tax=Mrakia frigida TaxID=29902 RepID=UPI003FCC00EE
MFLSLLLLPLSVLSLYIWFYIVKPRRSLLLNLPGPPSDSFIFGSLKGIIKEEPGKKHDRWMDEYGSTYRYDVLAGEIRFFTADPRAINHIMSNCYDYPKPGAVRRGLAEMLGNGILSAEGDVHKRQRRIMLPSFSAASMRPLVPLFFDKAFELKDKILQAASEDPNVVEKTGEGQVDVMLWIGRATLDVIGLAGFGFAFDSMKTAENELANAFKRMFAASQDITVLAILQNFFPIFKMIPSKRAKVTKESLGILNRVASEMVAEKKAAVLALSDGKVEKGDLLGRDLLTLLVRANMASDLPPSQTLSDAELAAQITTFLLAGFETSSTSLTWILHALVEYPAVQKKLRAELLAVSESTPDADQLSALPYLDAVVRESLRLYAPVTSTIRVSTKDIDTIPLSTPVIGRDGKEMNEITIGKDVAIFIPILSMNRSEAIFGPDAKEFKPERWLSDIPQTAKELEVPFAHILTFIAGPRSCIGYRFALLEIKAILFTLVRELNFRHIDPVPVYERKSSLVQRPRIIGRESEGYQMLLRVTPYVESEASSS